MLISMTGYVSLSEQIQLFGMENVVVSIELKTLNSRFFELVVNVPDCLDHLEFALSKLIQKKLVRGRAYLNIRLGCKEGKAEKIVPSLYSIKQYLEAIEKIKETYPVEGNLTLSDLLQLPDVFAAQEGEIQPEDEKILFSLVEKAAEGVLSERTREGASLEQDLKKMFKICKEKITLIDTAFITEVNQHKEMLKKAIEEQKESEQQDPRVEELQIALRKMDIQEEITRFKSHIKNIDSFLSTPDVENGKRLDFVLQELLRETNTMMAKCPTYQISAACIDIKVELEKAREQAQNIV